jgi:hypothetical protein
MATIHLILSGFLLAMQDVLKNELTFLENSSIRFTTPEFYGLGTKV